ncbi:beta-mannosidase [Agaribacter flavus]|uniref:Beta-mannosidase B n=1 Tax=Agaribacter flavus TaxID=1902781 RepID=A0ABV7FJY1_9ALTE
MNKAEELFMHSCDKQQKLKNKLANCEWRFKQSGTNTWRPASVPGCNFSDLLEAGVINDPFYADEETRLQWIEHQDWEYETSFEMTERELLALDWELFCEGLDTYCDVRVNDKHIASVDNMFLSHCLRIKEYLRAGINTLHFYFYSPIRLNQHLPAKNGLVYPAENDKSDNKLSVYVRKAPYHFGWDWGPRFVTSGIWRPVHLLPVFGAKIVDAYATQSHKQSHVQLTFSLTVECAISTYLTVVAKCNNVDIAPSIKHLSVQAGDTNTVELSFVIEKPNLWWPVGQGLPFLYEFSLSLLDDNQRFCSIDKKIGLRTIELVQEKDEFGQSFYFKVNGRAIFMKGANYIPSDSFLQKVRKEKYDTIFADVLAANMNMLRVWGGGIYEDDYFYELADKHGILVWQDFMFACTLYPADKAFLNNVKDEVICNIKRLRSHPCIALWCGNNEIAMGIECWGWQENFGYSDTQYAKLKQDYEVLFHQLLPSLVNELHPEIDYIASSPISFWERPEEDLVGDNHYWGVWHGELPFSEFKTRVPRFMSEYGFQAFPLLSSIKHFCPESDYFLDSPTMLNHQKHPRGNNIIKKHIEAEFNAPKDFESFLFLSQLLQAQALGTAFLAHRKAQPFCMGTLYWQLNDCWPVTSWSSIDYYGKYKAAHYEAKALFRDRLIAADVDGDTVTIYALNDAPEAYLFNIVIKLMSLSGEEYMHANYTCIAPGNSSSSVVSLMLEEVLEGVNMAEVFLLMLWQNADGEKENSIYYFTENKELPLKKPNILVDVSILDGQISISLTADTLVRYVYLSFPICDKNFSENFFDLVPNVAKSVSIKDDVLAQQGLELVKESLEITSLYDTYN